MSAERSAERSVEEACHVAVRSPEERGVTPDGDACLAGIDEESTSELSESGSSATAPSRAPPSPSARDPSARVQAKRCHQLLWNLRSAKSPN